MILTEKEAAKRLCPFAKSFNGSRTQLDFIGDKLPRCAGSECMAWDWIDSEYEHKRVQVRSDREVKFSDELAAEIAEQFPGFVPGTSGWGNPSSTFREIATHSTIYWPPYDEQVLAIKAEGDFDSRKIKSVSAWTVGVRKPRESRNGECKRAVGVREAD